ncbi:hypothetical protein DFAR_2790001 [Desulfarculales bacterium]
MTDKPRLNQEPYHGPDPASALKGSRQAFVPTADQFRQVPVYDGAKLRHGMRLTGPAIVEQENTSTFVTPEYRLVVDSFGTMTIYLPAIEQQILGRIVP